MTATAQFGQESAVFTNSTQPPNERKQLETWLQEFLSRSAISLPRPPAVALEILALSRKPNAKIEDLTSLLEREPLLAGRVLRLANTALYGASVPCVTLKQALIRMGLALVRDVVMEAAAEMTVLHLDGFNHALESIRRHSSAVAWISRFVARHTPQEAENAFLVGLLHDVGLSACLVGVSEYLTRQRRPSVLNPDAWRVVDEMHSVASEKVLASWGLPESVTMLVRQHHEQDVLTPQIAVLRIAEQIAVEAGWLVEPIPGASWSNVETAHSEETEEALKLLNLTPAHFETIKADTQRILETLDGQFKKK